MVRDEHESGRHQGDVEYGGTEVQVSTQRGRFCTLAQALHKPLLIAWFALAAATGFSPKSTGKFLNALLKTGDAITEQRKTAEKALQLACPEKAPLQPPLP